MKLAIVSDTHGNSAALRSVLADVETVAPGIDIYDLGDLLDGGPRPKQVLEIALPRYLGFVRGNHEDYQSLYLAQPNWEKRHHELWRMVPHGVKSAGSKLESFLAMQKSHFQVTPNITLLHASLTSNAKVPSFLPPQGLDPFSVPSCHEVNAEHFYFMGHTHFPGIHKSPEGDIWINVGSVGYPFLGNDMTLGLRFNPRATWVLLEIIEDEKSLLQKSHSEELYRSLTQKESEMTAENSKQKSVMFRRHYHEKLGVGKKSKIKIEFRVVSYDAAELLSDWHESGALSEGMPFSLAILAQSLWNQDLTYQIFKSTKSYEPAALTSHFKSELKRLRICENILEQGVFPEIARTVESIRKKL